MSSLTTKQEFDVKQKEKEVIVSTTAMNWRYGRGNDDTHNKAVLCRYVRLVFLRREEGGRRRAQTQKLQ
jgi:hypothetical protein